jgi:PAS domain S-box-containing protein
VLIISTGSRLAPGFAIVDQQLLQVLKTIQSPRIETYAENLDLVSFPSENYRRIFSEYLTAKYAEFPPDLVILVFVGNLGISGKLLPQLFPKAPIIVAGFTEENLQDNQFDTRVGGVAQRINPQATLELIDRLQPEVNRIIVIGGTADVDRQVTQRLKQAAQQFKERFTIEIWDHLTIDELREAVKNLPDRTAILFGRLFRDAAGQALISSEVARALAQVANAPVYVMTDANLGTAAVGGSIGSIEAFGKRAGELARLVLTGTPPASLPFEIRADSVPTFNWPALKRWGIDENRLPQNSVIRFRPEPLWKAYRWYIIGGLVIIALQAGIIADLLIERRRRARIQADLKESQQMMELATSAGGLGLWAREVSDGNIWLNASMRSLFGFGADDVVRFKDLLGRIHPDDRAYMIAEVERAQKAGLPFEGEFRIQPVQGAERWVLAKGRTSGDPIIGIKGRMGVVLDISERRRAEEKVRESEERFRSMADAAPVMIWMSDTDKLCTFFNKGWLDFTGRTLPQECGNGWSDGVHEDDFHRCVEVYSTAFDARKNFTMEYRLRRHDGEYRWILDHGVPRYGPDSAFLGYIGTATDITERKRGAESLEEERAFLRQVIDTTPNFIFAKDRDGRFTLANQAVADAYGTTVENLIGKTDADFNPDKGEIESFRRIDREVMDTLEERFIPEERLTDFKGKIRWVQTVKRPIIGSDGQARQVLGASTDITRRRETELELREQRAELAHVARISTMGELAASLAHELNQPLTAILSNAQAALRFLSGKPADLEEVREILGDIVQDNSRAGEVIRRIRALVKKEEPEFTSVNLVSLVRDVVVLLHSDAILQNVRIVLELEDGLAAVRGDKVQLQQVVLNLMLNAFDAMKDCGVPEREVKLRVAREEDSGSIQVTVKDRGRGLSMDKLDKIFQPFYTTKREGLGMGLSICRSIIEAHRGRLWAENNPDDGATFYFTVPVAEQTTDEDSAIGAKESFASFK